MSLGEMAVYAWVRLFSEYDKESDPGIGPSLEDIFTIANDGFIHLSVSPLGGRLFCLIVSPFLMNSFPEVF